MDPDNQPSTSKKYTSKIHTKQSEEHALYPVTFDEFKKYTNVEEYVVKDMKLAGPNIYRINYKIRHKFYPIVYKKFYANEATRKLLFKNGLALKPMPRFLKDKLMMMPADDDKLKVDTLTAAETSKHNNKLSRRIEQLNNIYHSPKSVEKENCPKLPQPNKVKRSTNSTPKPDRPKVKPLNAEIRKITSFFTALKSPANNIAERDVRKRKASLRSASAEPKEKRLKNARPKSENITRTVQNIVEGKRKKRTETLNLDELHSDLISDDALSNVQIMVEVAVPIKNVSCTATKCPKLPAVANKPSPKGKSTNDHRIAKTSNQKKQKGIESRPPRKWRKIIATVFDSDDSDIDSSSQMADDPKSLDSDIIEICNEIGLTPEKSPLPKRNRTENFKNHALSPQEKDRKINADADKTFFNLTENFTFNVSSDYFEWEEDGVKAMKGDAAPKTIEFRQEEFTSVDRLEAIKTHSAEVSKYIKHLLNLEIPKTRGRASTLPIAQRTSRSKVVSAFLQMSFEEFKYLINANCLLIDGILPDSVIINLKKQYEAIVKKKKPWPKGVHVKLPTLKTFLQLKGIQPPIQLQHIPPRLLNFTDVLVNTNLKEYLSFSREEPPDSYKRLLHLCKKEYQKCCQDGIWNEGMQFNDELIKPESVKPNVESSDLKGEDNALKGQCALESGQSCQLDQVVNASGASPQTTEDKSAQPHISKPESVHKKKRKKRIMNSFQNNQAIEDYLDEMFKDSESESETTESTALADHDYYAIKRSLLADIDKLRSSSMDQIAVAPIEMEPDDALLASPKRSEGLKEPEQITENVNIPASSEESPLALKEPEQISENVNISASSEESPLASKEPEQITENVTIPASSEESPLGLKKSEQVTANVNVPPAEPLPTSSEETMAITIDDTSDFAGQLVSAIIQPTQTENGPEFCISEESIAITIDDTPDSAGQLLSAIIQPTQAENVPEFHIPPSPNLFQSSGESQVNCTKSQEINALPPEAVYVPCKHTMTFHTEQNNLTVFIDETSDSEDPFVETTNNQEDTMVTLASLDPDVVVKRELLSQRNVAKEGYDFDFDESLEIIEVPSPEPIVIDDSQETTQSLIDILISQRTKSDQSNVNNSHYVVLTAHEDSEGVAVVSDSQLPETKMFMPPPPQNVEVSSLHGLSNCDDILEIVDVPSPEPIVIEDEETAPELLDMLLDISRPPKTTNSDCVHVNLNPYEPSFSCLENFPQAQRFPSHLSFAQSQSNVNQWHDVSSIPKQVGAENGEENEVEFGFGVVPSNGIEKQFQDASMKVPKVPEQTPPSESSESVSYVSIAPQNIPSDIEYTQSGSNEPSQQAKDHGGRQTTDQLSSQECDDDDSTVYVYVTLKSDATKKGSMEIVCSEAEKTLRTGSGKDVPEVRTNFSNDTEEAACSSIQDPKLKSLSPWNCETVQALETLKCSEEGNSYMAVGGTGLQEQDVNAALEKSKSDKLSKEASACESSEGELIDVDEVSTGVQLFKKPQQCCVFTDLSKVDSEASHRQESEHCQDQLRNVESSRSIHVSDDAAASNAKTVSLTDESKIVELARATLPQDAEDCGSPAPSLIKDVNASIGQANRCQAQQDKANEVEPPKVVSCALTEYTDENPQEAVSSRNTQQHNVPDTVPIELSKAPCETPQGSENRLKNVRISRGTHRRHVSKNDAQKDDFASDSGENNQETRPTERNQETGEYQQIHPSADKPMKSKGESRNGSDCQESPERLRNASQFTFESKNVMFSSVTEAPAKEFTFSSQQIEEMNFDDEDGVSMGTFYDISSLAAIESFLEIRQNHDDSRTSLGISDLCVPANEILPNNVSNFDSKIAVLTGGRSENTDFSASSLQTSVTQKPTEMPKETTEEHILQKLGPQSTASDSPYVIDGTQCNVQTIFSTDCLEVVVETTKDHNPNRLNFGYNLGSLMGTSCSPVALQDSSHAMETPSAIERSPKIPASSTKNISEAMALSNPKLQPTLDYPASKGGQTIVVNQFPSNIAEKTEPSIIAQASGAPNTNEFADATKAITKKTYSFPAVLAVGAISNDRPDEIIEGETVAEGDEEDVVVPFLIKGRFLKSLPFKLLSQYQVQLYWETCQILGMEVQFESNLNENASSFVEPGEKETMAQGSEVDTLPLATQNMKKMEMKAPALGDPQVSTNSAPESIQKTAMSSTAAESTLSSTGPQSTLSKIVEADTEPQFSVQPTSSNRKAGPKTSKTKATTKKSSKKPLPDFVPQKTHAFRSLPLAAVKKPLPSETPSTHPPLTTVEEVDFLIEDASQVIPTSATASQILGADCTYFDSSQLLKNIEEYCATSKQAQQQQQCRSRTNSKVKTLNPPTILSDGITARKVWKVHLQWTTQRKMTIETRFITGRRWLSSYDESAKLMFNFSPTTWSNVFRVLKEIDHYEYRRMAAKERKHCAVVTPLHRVLRFLFDTAPQIVNVRLINDTHSPFTMCEKSTPLYRKPFQCLTKGIPASVLSRMKALKQDLRTANSDE